MCDPLPLGKKTVSGAKENIRLILRKIRKSSFLHLALIMLVFGSIVRLFDSLPTSYALAYEKPKASPVEIKSPLFEQKNEIFEVKKEQNSQINPKTDYFFEKKSINGSNELFAQKIYEIVGETPIKEMVPYISGRDEKVAAFLVGIAKKESSFGLASPSKDGKTCYNYWGYKGSAGRGTGMGYACFASAEEAVNVVGNRIEVLVGKNRSTPAKMVDTWKCGTSCKGDPGAPGWVSTVALYFDKLVEKNS